MVQGSLGSFQVYEASQWSIPLILPFNSHGVCHQQGYNALEALLADSSLHSSWCLFFWMYIFKLGICMTSTYVPVRQYRSIWLNTCKWPDGLALHFMCLESILNHASITSQVMCCRTIADHMKFQVLHLLEIIMSSTLIVISPKICPPSCCDCCALLCQASLEPANLLHLQWAAEAKSCRVDKTWWAGPC